MQPKIDVCVATYKRPELLNKLLLSLRAQETGGEFSFTIIVADNVAQPEAIVKDFNATGQKIIYGVAPEQNISLGRNKSLSLAAGDYIATIDDDDDEYANRQWLLHLYKTIVDYQADVVFGSVVAVFHAKTPEYIRKSGAFNLPNPPSAVSHTEA